MLIGIPVCWVLSKLDYTITRESTLIPGKTITTWKGSLFWIFGNEEDGVYAEWFEPGLPRWKRIFLWTGIRNSCNNLGRIFPFGIVPTSKNTYFIGNPETNPHSAPAEGQIRWMFIWYFCFAGFLWTKMWRGKYYQLWIGWKMLPKDILGYGTVRLSFAFDPKRF
jgi:hypothetical protein